MTQRLNPSPAPCPSCGVNPPGGARFCGQCGAFLAREPDQGGVRPQVGGATERRQVAILFYDMVGSSVLAGQLDPEDFAEVLGAFHRHVGAIIVAHEGHTARYLGDGGMIYFGYPQAAETDAERAVRAGLEILASLPALTRVAGRPIHARVGIAAGVALTGDVLGHGPDVAGAAPNLAARLQGLAEQDTLLIDEALHRLVGPLFDCRPLGAQPVDGWAEPVRLWQVLGHAAIEGRFDARTRAYRSPLIGRDAEAARLRDLWDAACGGGGQVVLVRGEAGIGKSRLVAQLLDDTEATPHRRYRFHCSPHQQGTPLHPSIELLERLAGFEPGDEPSRKQAKLVTRLAGTPPDDIALIARLLMLPGPAGHPGLGQLPPQRARDRTLAALVDTMVRAAEGLPVLMVLEDAHWADPTTLELTTRMAGRIAGLRALMIVTARPDFRPGWPGDGSPHAEVTLEPLPPADSATLARHAAVSLGEGAIADIVARCDGNPLFLEEVARGVAEATAKEATAKDRPRAVPASLHASLLGRLDHLGPARELARVAAVVGRTFGRPMLAAVSGLTGPDLDAAIGRLMASGLVQTESERDMTYRFKHALIQDAAYDSVTRARRRDLHARVATATLALNPAAASGQPQTIAHHFTEAGRASEAIQWWISAARLSLQRSASVEAVAQVERAIGLAQALPKAAARTRTELELQLLLGKALMASLGQSSTRTGNAFARALTLSQSIPDKPHVLTLLFGLWSHALMRGDVRAARAKADEIAELGRGRDDPAWVLTAHYTRGLIDFIGGDFSGARQNLETGIALFDPAHPEKYTGIIVGNPRVLMRMYLSWALLQLGRSDEALDNVLLALDEARRLGPAWTLCFALMHRGQIAVELEGPAQAAPFWREAYDLARETQIPYYEASCDLWLGWMAGVSGDADAGLARMASGFARYETAETGISRSSFTWREAEVHLAAGDLDRAAARLAQARADALARGELWDEAAMLIAEGRIAAARGDAAAAARAYERAIAVARRQGCALYEGQARVWLARLEPVRVTLPAA